jgi:hypothetical protein
MKTTVKFIFRSMLVLTAVAVVVTGCRKKKEEDNDTGSASDNAFAEASYNDMSTIGDQASTGTMSTFRNGNDEGSLLSACATITFNNANSSDNDSITVDFGSTNCMCADGRYRRGKILITYTGGMQYRDSNMVVHFNPMNYYVNDNNIAGTKTVTNRGHINGKLTWDIVVNGVITLANNGGTITWNSTRTRVLLAGETTYNGPINWSIAKIGVTGSANGTTANNESYTATITSQIIRDMSCGANRRHFVQGTLDFTPGNKPTRHIDFGNGTCDDIAVVTIGSNSYTVHMR